MSGRLATHVAQSLSGSFWNRKVELSLHASVSAKEVGYPLGGPLGDAERFPLGGSEGMIEGDPLGLPLGLIDGDLLGTIDGLPEGDEL